MIKFLRMTNTGKSITLEDYKKYQDSEYCALLLKQLYFPERKDRYQALQDYVKRFPKSLFTPEIANEITDIESMSVSLSYPKIRSSRDSIPVSMNVENANSFNIVVYSLPESALNDGYRLNWSGAKVVNTIPVTVPGTIPFNEYNLKKNLPAELYADDIMRVTDMAMITINRSDHKDKVGTVDINSGKPIPGVAVKYQDHNDKDYITLGSTNANGLVAVPMTFKSSKNKNNNSEYVFSGMNLKAIKGEDKFAPAIGYYKMDERNVSDYDGIIYTDLGVYRPGETVQWAAIAYYTNNDGRQPLAERDVEVIFKDNNHKAIDTLRLETDAYGRVEGAFVVPKDRMNGQFSLEMKLVNGSSYNSQLAWLNVNVSEYKTPTFAVTFPDARHNYVSGQPVKVSGKVETYSGMPVANTEVRLSLIQKEWSWWWWRASNNDGQHLMDTIVKPDAQGLFTFSYEPTIFEENKSRSNYGWSRYNYQVVATATTDAGETQEESTTFIVGTRRGIELGFQNWNVYFNDKPI